MRQPLNASGSAFVQANELAQSPADLAGSMLLLQTDFDQWMDERFELSSSQRTQIADMDPTFKATLAELIARELLAGRTIAFAKTGNTEKLRDKDVYIFSSTQQSYSFDSDSMRKDEGLQILITYR
ncbi:hypothetical protein [Sphingobacterium faecale]|uniref:Uncharacterized protein n=1 Tax=Sphingobacterium faecale TaxID=2803775 RepID=A0ABS1R504_9SPHI|nr:hypothetical protein [Sphingobacterium faecale]MBL1409087.1 hypothetical protein [Sphingobacterium faecale]